MTCSSRPTRSPAGTRYPGARSTPAAGGRPSPRPAITEADIDFPLRMHDLGHAHASWLLAGGADLKSVMERMGHSQIMTTQKYLHTLPEADQKALAAFESVRRRDQLVTSGLAASDFWRQVPRAPFCRPRESVQRPEASPHQECVSRVGCGVPRLRTVSGQWHVLDSLDI